MRRVVHVEAGGILVAFILPSTGLVGEVNLKCPGFDAVSIMWLEGCRKGDCCYGTSIEVHIRVAAASR